MPPVVARTRRAAFVHARRDGVWSRTLTWSLLVPSSCVLCGRALVPGEVVFRRSLPRRGLACSRCQPHHPEVLDFGSGRTGPYRQVAPLVPGCSHCTELRSRHGHAAWWPSAVEAAHDLEPTPV